jgi:hypothetical protein
MIVWGGGYSADYSNDGNRYDPAADSWTPTSTGAGVPAARRNHTAIWTGTEMIVWGGSGEALYMNTGGRYDPATDGWTPTSTGAGAPAGRYYHTAIWTGMEMTVWGGRASGGPSGTQENTGGRYDPATDAWTPTSVGTGVPSGRSSHSAVWTGTEMIVWGGHGVWPDPYANTGGRYDPATDAWTPTSTGAGVPEPRDRHTAVWTGTEMVVWGGRYGLPGADICVNTGGRYDPATDAWTPTSTGSGVPESRYRHTAVWTGAEMIVFGGVGETGDDLNSGGLLCVCGDGAVSNWYPDADGDGYGVSSTGLPSCSEPPGYAAVGGDCDDAHSSCTTDCTTDADLDGLGDCADTCIDLDGDNYGSAGGAGYSCLGFDCDDTVPSCTTDCTDADGDDLRDCSDDSCIDGDGDGYGVAGGAGNTCIGADCDDAIGSCTTDCTDADGDDFFVCGGDCDDGDAGVNPAALETCNGVDDDCNGLTDDDADGEDSDGDTVHNRCDNCPDTSNPSQSDIDQDAVGDACDNCPLERNADQCDVDDDLEGDRCDLDDGLVYVWFDSTPRVEWQEEAGFDAWNCYCGDLDELRASGTYTQLPGSNPLADRTCGMAVPGMDDFTSPEEGRVAFYLVTGMLGSDEGSLGTDSFGNERPNDEPCP